VTFFVWSARSPRALQAVVSTVHGEAYTTGNRPSVLVPKARVPEGQRLRTSASGSLETRVGKHLVAVGPNSDLGLDSLRPSDLRFRLERGSVTMTVSPLGPDGHLRVFAGELSVEVVGTVFRVERDGNCSSVSVRSGRVAVSYQGRPGTLGAGESRQFCPAMNPVSASPAVGNERAEDAPRPNPSAQTAQGREERPSGPGRKLAALETTPSLRSSRTPRPSGPSDEERLFVEASRPDGDAWSRARRLQDYLVHFPEGTFAEDALFRLVRLSYADGNSAQVVRFSDQFLRRHQGGRRATEVRLLYVQSAVELGLPASQSLGALESLLEHLDSLPRSQHEQATYLAVLTYCGQHRSSLCTQWIERYLAAFPRGTYAADVRRNRNAWASP
jgi:hypothetical protein